MTAWAAGAGMALMVTVASLLLYAAHVEDDRWRP